MSKSKKAYQQWAMCNKVISQGGLIKYPEQALEVAFIGKIQMDTLFLSKLTDGDANKLIMGVLNYGNKRIQNKILSRFPDSEQFQDMMVELQIGASHIMNGDQVTPLEAQGRPDIKVQWAGCSDSMYIECKHLRSRDERRIIEIINKANTQLKKTESDSYGCLVIQVAQPVNTGGTSDNPIPPEVSQVINVVRQSLSGEQNKAIGAALVIWDGFTLMGTPPEDVAVCYCRKQIRVNHTSPRKVIPSTVKLFQGMTFFYKVKFKPKF